MKTVSLEHPILFVFDFSSEDVEIPECAPDTIASSSASVVSVRVVSEVDGEVTIALTDSCAGDADGTEVFVGAIATPGRRIAVVASGDEKLLEKSVAGVMTEVRIRVDDEDHPTRLCVEAR